MKNCRMESIEEYDDIDTKNQYQIALEAGMSVKEAMDACFRHSRDNARTPMQWNGGENAGFTSGTPWMKVNPNYQKINVDAEKEDASSVFSYYKKLLALRKSADYREVFTYGDFIPAYDGGEMIFAYHRKNDNRDVLIAANFGRKEAALPVERAGEILLRNRKDILVKEGKLVLPGCGAAVMEI